MAISKLNKAQEKSPLRSKKFVAYLIAEMTWKLLLIIGLGGVIYMETNTHLSEDGVSIWFYWVLMSCVLIAGFVEAGFIGGQAWLDKYVRVAQIAAARDGTKTEIPLTKPPSKPPNN